MKLMIRPITLLMLISTITIMLSCKDQENITKTADLIGMNKKIMQESTLLPMDIVIMYKDSSKEVMNEFWELYGSPPKIKELNQDIGNYQKLMKRLKKAYENGVKLQKALTFSKYQLDNLMSDLENNAVEEKEFDGFFIAEKANVEKLESMYLNLEKEIETLLREFPLGTTRLNKWNAVADSVLKANE